MSVEKKCQRSGWSGDGPFVYYRGGVPCRPVPQGAWQGARLPPRATCCVFWRMCGTFSWQMWDSGGVMFFQKNRNSMGTPWRAMSSLGASQATCNRFEDCLAGELLFVGQIGMTWRNVVLLLSDVLVLVHLGVWPSAVCLGASPSPCHMRLVRVLLGNIMACLVHNVVWLPSDVLVWVHLGAWPCAVCLGASSPSPCCMCLVRVLLGNIMACLVHNVVWLVSDVLVWVHLGA
jgi:hypothetical protein